MRTNPLTTVLLAAAITAPVSAQESESRPRFTAGQEIPEEPKWSYSREFPEGIGFLNDGGTITPAGYRKLSRSFELKKAVDSYYTAKGVDEKNAAAKTIQESLSKEFDADLKKRQADLAAIRKRVEEMEASLKKRLANRQAIIDLRKQVLLNESEGLGWAAGGNRRSYSNPRGAAGYWTEPPAFAPPAPPQASYPPVPAE